MSATENRALYLAWLRENFPELYDSVTQGTTASGITAPSLASDPGRDSLGGVWDSISDAFTSTVKNVTQALPTLATAYGTYRSQSELIKLNTQRAQAGLAPLVQGVNGQLTPYAGGGYTDAEYRLAQSGMSTTSMAYIAVALVLGVLLLRSS